MLLVVCCSHVSAIQAFSRTQSYRGLNKSPIVMLTNTTKPPPPRPCIALAVINMPIVTDNAAIRDPTKNMKLAMSRTGFRPQISLSFPQIVVEAATARRYEEPIHVYPDAVWKCSAMVGSAVVTMVLRLVRECKVRVHSPNSRYQVQRGKRPFLEQSVAWC